MDEYETLITVLTVVYSVTGFFALIYSCLIIFNRRFHHSNNIFILNICINIITSCIYFTTYFQIRFWNMPIFVCVIFFYCFNIASMQIPCSVLIFTIHRCCLIFYHTNQFFKRKRWIIFCISMQWFIQFIVSLPRPLYQYTVNIICLIFFVYFS